MLVITRRTNEEILIAGNVRLRVLEIRGQRVQLGIEAPLDVSIRRNDAPQLGHEWDAGTDRVPRAPR